MELSQRLQTIADMVTQGGVVADVGTDHGYLAIFLIQQKKAHRVIAMDVAKGPLSKAVENIGRAGLQESIETRQSDGAAMLKPFEADTVVMAGMGGNLIMRLLQKDEEILNSVPELVLSPQSDIEQVRIFLDKHSYIIKEERMLTEDAKNYVVMRVEHGSMHYERECHYRYGKLLLEHNDPVLYRVLVSKQQELLQLKCRLDGMDTESARTRLLEIERELACILEGLKYYEKR
jgi:tRNA (adenine22-N1)-methyltransferase